MHTLLLDLRTAVRTLRRRPAFTFPAVLTLALGIGAGTAIFSLFAEILWKPLPYPESERLVKVWSEDGKAELMHPSYPDFVDWQQQSSSFESLVAYRSTRLNLTAVEEPRRVWAEMVSQDFFRLLGEAPTLGRGFVEEDAHPAAAPTAILSHRLWQREFGDRTGIEEARLTLGETSYEVVGVMPPDFEFTAETDLWLPIGHFTDDPRLAERSNHGIQVLGRLAPTIDLVAAESELNSVAAGLAQQYPDTNAELRVQLRSLYEERVGHLRGAFLLLAATVAAVLLIACANVANMILARVTSRATELKVKTALGASRGRILRQLLTESLLLALLAVAFALPLAGWLVEAAARWQGSGFAQTTVDHQAFLFALLLALLTGLLAGLVPALLASRPNGPAPGAQQRTLAVGGKGPSALFVGLQLAVSLVLLVAAGLLGQSFLRLSQVDPGFTPQGIWTLELSLPEARYSDAADITNFYRRLLQELKALPQVETAAASETLPLLASESNHVVFEGRAIPAAADLASVDRHVVTPGYLRTLDMPQLAGRSLEDRDGATGTPVALINQTMAEMYWPGESPLGRRFRWHQPDLPLELPWLTVVGVVADVRQEDYAQPPRPAHYLPLEQVPAPILPYVSREMFLAARLVNDGAATASLADLRHAVLRVDPALPPDNLRPMTQVVASSLARRLLLANLVGTLAALALLLASSGLYSVMAFAVSQRRREIGIRMALGADRRGVLRKVVMEGLALATLGIFAGLLLAAPLSHLLAGLLYDIRPTDLNTFTAVPLFLLLVAAIASWLPARRAAEVDPVVALRWE